MKCTFTLKFRRITTALDVRIQFGRFGYIWGRRGEGQGGYAGPGGRDGPGPRHQAHIHHHVPAFEDLGSTAVPAASPGAVRDSNKV